MSRLIEITDHHDFCSYKNKREDECSRWANSFCDLNPEIFVILLNCDFFVIQIPQCHVIGSRTDYILSLIKQIKNLAEFKEEIFYINKSITDKDFRDLRIRGEELNTTYYECCYNYYDNAGRNYKIVAEKKLTYDKIENYNNSLIKNYNEIVEKIKKHKNEKFILSELEELYNINKIKDWSSNIERIKTVDVLIKKLKNYETSKQ